MNISARTPCANRRRRYRGRLVAFVGVLAFTVGCGSNSGTGLVGADSSQVATPSSGISASTPWPTAIEGTITLLPEDPSDEPFASGSPGRRIRDALLVEFLEAKASDRMPPRVATLTDPHAKAIGDSQIGGLVSPENPRCRKWAQGVWSAAYFADKKDPRSIFGGSFLVGGDDPPFAGFFISEAIVRVPANTARDIMAETVSDACRSFSFSDGKKDYPVTVVALQLKRPAGEKLLAYRINHQTVGVPATWAAVIQIGAHILEVRMKISPASSDLVGQQELLEDLLQQAYLRAKATLQ